jgi:hypothetical protein
MRDFFVKFFYFITWKQLKFVGVVSVCVIYVFQYLYSIFKNFLCVRFLGLGFFKLQNNDFLKNIFGLGSEFETN